MNVRLWSICLALPLLAACSREPSETELQQAYERSLQDANQIAARVGGQHMKIELKEFKKHDCQPVEPKGFYHCRFQADLLLPIIGLTSQPGELTVTQKDHEWVIANHY